MFIMLASEWMNFGSNECIGISMMWYQFIILSWFEACGVQRFHLQEVYARDQFSMLPKWRNLWHCSISKIFHVMLATLFLKRKFPHVGHMWVTSGLFSGSNGSSGMTHFQSCDGGQRGAFKQTFHAIPSFVPSWVANYNINKLKFIAEGM